MICFSQTAETSIHRDSLAHFELAGEREDAEEIDLRRRRLQQLIVRLHRLERAVEVRRDAAELRRLYMLSLFLTLSSALSPG